MTRFWRRRVAFAVAIWFLLCAAGLFLDAHPRPALLALAVAATGVALLLFLDVQTPPVSWTLQSDEPVRARGEDPGLVLLSHLVSEQLYAREPGARLRRHLVEIVDRRLLAHHGISRIADPERAAALMGPALAQFVTAAPPYPRMTPSRIAQLADRIEEL
ncbi:MAG TPA: hypothetical protein VFJ09_05680 [Nocardioidaceae bacterium]|jgi:hypothetical protein|nr:hypothetical protein [Nocardioidaceae bacterium]